MNDFFNFHLTKKQIRAFVIGFIGIFLIVSLHYLGVRVPKLVSPLPREVNIWNVISPKLEQRTNTFHLKKTSTFFPKSYASSRYDLATSYALIDFETGEILFNKSSSKQVPVASLTKIMTAIVALDLADPKEVFTVSPFAPKVVPTIMGVTSGQQLELNELLQALLMTSANDAAEVIREGIDDKYQKVVFIDAMNAKANLLGLKNTHFDNPQGYDSRYNYSTAEDLAILSHYALTNYPLISEIAKKDFTKLPKNTTHEEFDLINWNGLIGVYPNIEGLKIGNTGRAQKTTVVVSKRGGKTMLVVLLGAPGVLERDLWTADLLDAGFMLAANLPPVGVTEFELRQKYSTWVY